MVGERGEGLGEEEEEEEGGDGGPVTHNVALERRGEGVEGEGGRRGVGGLGEGWVGEGLEEG